MVLTSAQVIDLLSTPTTKFSALPGKIENLRRFASTSARDGVQSSFRPGEVGRPNDGLTAAQSQLLDAMATMPTPPNAKHLHPGAMAQPEVRKDPALTPSELAWLGQLPLYPNEVSFQDAKTLAGLAVSLRRDGGSKADQRLVESYWAPVREHHDKLQAEAEIVNASHPLPPLPAVALNALGDAVAAETTELHPDELVFRASNMLAGTAQKRTEEHAQRLRLAQAGLKAVTDRAAERVATTAPEKGSGR